MLIYDIIAMVVVCRAYSIFTDKYNQMQGDFQRIGFSQDNRDRDHGGRSSHVGGNSGGGSNVNYLHGGNDR